MVVIVQSFNDDNLWSMITACYGFSLQFMDRIWHFYNSLVSVKYDKVLEFSTWKSFPFYFSSRKSSSHANVTITNGDKPDVFINPLLKS